MMAETANQILLSSLRKTVVIADDNSTTRRCIKAHLEAIGCEVVASVSNGTEAIEAVLKFNPSLVILDVNMPEMDGLSAARSISEKRNIPIILVTGMSDEKTITEAMKCSIAAYLVKPVTRKDLAPAIEVAMARHGELSTLKNEVETLRDAIETRKLVEKAKGILMKRCSIGEDEAFKLLQQHSQKENKKMREIAHMVIDASKLI